MVPLHASGGSGRTTGSRSSSRARATRASSATRSGAIPPTARPCGTRSGRRASRTGSTPLGLEALDILRIESGLIFAGYEFDDQVDPFEAGIGFAVDLEDGRRLRRPRGARGAQGAPAADARRARARGQRDRRPRRRGLRRPPAGRRRDERHAQPDPEEEHRARAGRGAVRGARDRASRSASSTGSRSGSRRPSSASRSTTRTRPARAPRRGDRRRRRAARTLHRRAGRVVRRDGFLIVEEGLDRPTARSSSSASATSRSSTASTRPGSGPTR